MNLGSGIPMLRQGDLPKERRIWLQSTATCQHLSETAGADGLLSPGEAKGGRAFKRGREERPPVPGLSPFLLLSLFYGFLFWFQLKKTIGRAQLQLRSIVLRHHLMEEDQTPETRKRICHPEKPIWMALEIASKMQQPC